MQKRPVEVDAGEMAEILDRYLDADGQVNYAVKIVGHPGIGKSSIVKQAAERKNRYFIDTRLAFKENIDLGGYPVPDHENRRMVYYRPRFIPPEEVPEGFDGIVWFLDEANRAHPTVIQTLFQVITEGRCGEHLLPEKTVIVIAGNLGEEDHTHITDFDDSALDGRLGIFHLKPAAEHWLDWARKSGIHPTVVRYISGFPERLWDAAAIHPNPRGWHQASQALRLSYGLGDEATLYTALSGHRRGSVEKVLASLVGELAASDFVTQILTPRQLTTHEILSGDEGAFARFRAGEVPVEDLLWAVSGAVTRIREKKMAGDEGLLVPLGFLLKYVAASRSDARVSFFLMLLRECGVFSQIPDAVRSVCEGGEREEVLSLLTDVVFDGEKIPA
ncbi:P-loop NTPase family protein [Desulfoluna spongiiphila]|uniref:hypothetical protein n=1 Tax=Desulfoluna spongiiphila TaxID=419481 RepID=UPI0012529F80|nr:hypothetical protein [Desulfoluna spongiiphila]VVS92254.1 clpa/b family [Desulfoluna spongiiphila]